MNDLDKIINLVEDRLGDLYSTYNGIDELPTEDWNNAVQTIQILEDVQMSLIEIKSKYEFVDEQKEMY